MPDPDPAEGRRLVAYRNEAGERVGLRTELVDEAGQRHAQGVAAGKVRPLAGDGFPGAGKASHLLTDLLRCDGCKRAMTFRGLSYKCGKERACGICPAPASAYAGALEREVVGRWLNVVMALEPTDALAVKIAERWTALTLPEETEEARGAREALVAAESSLGRLMADRQAGLYDGPAARYFAPLHRDAIDAVSSLLGIGAAAVDLDRSRSACPDGSPRGTRSLVGGGATPRSGRDAYPSGARP